MMKLREKFVTLLLSVAMVVSFMSVLGMQTAYAADETEPDPIQDLYEIKGVNYYNAGSKEFENDKYKFYRDLILNGSEQLGGRSMADIWLEVAAGLMYGKTRVDTQYTIVMDRMARETQSSHINLSVGENFSADKYPNQNQGKRLMDTDITSLKNAEDYVYKVAGMQKVHPHSVYDYLAGTGEEMGNFINETDGQVVIPAAIRASSSSDNDGRVAAVYFTNFKVIPILPSDEGKNYVTVETVQSKETPAAASVVRNNSASEVTGSQTVSSSYSASVSNTVGGSFTHSYQESIAFGNEFKDGFFNKFHLDFTFTFQQTFNKNWSDTTSTTQSDSTSRSISVNLPPYTCVMLKQKTTDAEAVTTYNCPIGITFDVAIVIYNKDGSIRVMSPDFIPQNAWYDNKLVFTFKANNGNARTALIKRYNDYKDYSEPDREGVRWDIVTSYDGDHTNGTHIREAINIASTYVPMSSAGGVLAEKLNMFESEVDGILPTLPLRGVSLLPMDVPFIVNDGSYNSYNFLKMKMPVGESTYTGYFKLGGYNARSVEYYGFSRAYGHWKVVDENEEIWTGDDAPVKIIQDTTNTWPRIKAVRPGTCYLKYFIDEDVYNTAESPDVYTKNSDLLYTAIIEIEVPDDRTIDVSGQFEGYVDEEPEALDADGKLETSLCDATGKEVNEEVTLAWEAKEKNGISVTDGNMVQFTKPGTYHVRAFVDSIKSDWVEITAKQRTFDVTFKTGNGRDDETVTVNKGQTVSAPSVDSGTCETFTGWYTDAECTQEADIAEPVTEDTTLYGGWEIQHDLISVLPISVDPACDGGGVIAHYRCRNCEKRFSDADAQNEISPEDTVTPAGHHLSRVRRQASTCMELGNIEYYVCSDCGGIFKDKNGVEELSEGDVTIPAKGHDWTEWETTKEPTEDEEGEQTRYCKNDPDNHIQTRAVPVLGHRHKMVKTPGSKPTCTEEGNRMYYTCSECGWVFTDSAGNNEIDPLDTVLPPTGHKWDGGAVKTKPTTQAEGQKVYTCTSCGETKTVSIPKLERKANPLAVKAKTAKVKYSKLKKKSQSVKRSKVIAITKKGQGTVKYKLSSVKKGSKSFKKYFKINAKSGKVTIKKGLKKGVYKVKVKVSAAGNANYKAAEKTVTFKIRVK